MEVVVIHVAPALFGDGGAGERVEHVGNDPVGDALLAKEQDIFGGQLKDGARIVDPTDDVFVGQTDFGHGDDVGLRQRSGAGRCCAASQENHGGAEDESFRAHAAIYLVSY